MTWNNVETDSWLSYYKHSLYTIADFLSVSRLFVAKPFISRHLQKSFTFSCWFLDWFQSLTHCYLQGFFQNKCLGSPSAFLSLALRHRHDRLDKMQKTLRQTSSNRQPTQMLSQSTGVCCQKDSFKEGKRSKKRKSCKICFGGVQNVLDKSWSPSFGPQCLAKNQETVWILKIVCVCIVS